MIIPAGAPPLHPARSIMPLDPKFLYNIAPSVAALPASLGALLLKQEQVSPSTMSLFRRRSYAPLTLVAIRACSSPFHDSSLILFRSGMHADPACSDEICLSGMRANFNMCAFLLSQGGNEPLKTFIAGAVSPTYCGRGRRAHIFSFWRKFRLTGDIFFTIIFKRLYAGVCGYCCKSELAPRLAVCI